jgi:hypothetical protein
VLHGQRNGPLGRILDFLDQNSYLAITRKEENNTIDNKNVEILNQFQYFLSIVTCDNNTNVEIYHRMILDNIKMDLLEIGWGGVDRIVLAQNRDKWRALVNAVMNLRVR